MVKCVLMEFIMQQGLLSAWRYVGVHCHGSEQCHVRVCICGRSEWPYEDVEVYGTVGISIDGCAAGREINMGKRSLLSEQPTYMNISTRDTKQTAVCVCVCVCQFTVKRYKRTYYTVRNFYKTVEWFRRGCQGLRSKSW